MLEGLRQRTTTEPAERSRTARERTGSKPLTQTTLFRVGRVIYGGILVTMAIDGLQNAEERVQYAAAKNVPMPRVANTVAHGLLLIGGVGIALWRGPALAASAVAAFFLGVTPAMHDFWSIEDPERRQQQSIQFLKNTALFGAALLLLGIARREK